MAISNKLVNPTQFLVDWEWNAGQHIKIKPDATYLLTTDQMQDFALNRPGSEAVQDLMADFGIFLLDTDRPYEVQCLESVTACLKKKREQYNTSTNTTRAERAKHGIVDNPEALEEQFRQMGLSALRVRIDELEERRKFLAGVVAERAKRVVPNAIDPDRTLIFTDPPMTFEDPIALQMFLNDKKNAAVAAKYKVWRAAYGKAPKVEEADADV